ncbi:mycothiol transferase [Saccharomonospora xinjiangensis]|uniref:DinB-like domain-containing protein n=1 Tax=Saccharomonospora xinjiangensis XJ-54 TaxID=882086 RepID=I0V3X8_9PSEU|nr:DUF664 domain-containing protein [Saccharomonospora xinjiangensis]EID54831.1 Protein of unknown function (DUF664) [Saccharomonospora xinjiangensis XJ-54]
MDSMGVLIDGFGRVREAVHDAVRGLGATELNRRIDEQANSIAWLLWHLTRVQDDHVSEVAGRDQSWTAEGFYDRFGLPLPQDDTGFGHTSEDVASVRVNSAKLLTGYHDAVHAHTISYLESITEADLDVVVDESWSPPVTLGVRLVSVIADDLQHAGQAAFVRGIVLRR